jgi:predicted nucleic acid-binding protein
MVPLMVRQAASAAAMQVLAQDPSIVTWWGSRIECASAMARLEREGLLSGPATDTVRVRYRLLSERWHEIEASEPLRRAALRLLRTHPLRSADALQLAAAVVASEGNPDSLGFVTLDARLADAADREGFRVIVPAAGPAT